MSYRGKAWMLMGIVCIAVWAAILTTCTVLRTANNPGDAIQGLYSHLNCDTQPGAAPWYVESNGQRFFMGCRNPGDLRQQPLVEQLGLDSTGAWHRFDTLYGVHGAAMYAARRLEQCSHYYECSTFIAKDSHGQFAVGPARTDYKGDGVRISANVPEDWNIVATVHTHPCIANHFPGLFSPDDMIGSITSRTIGFMVNMCTGNIQMFTPGISKADDVELKDEGIWLSAGTVIGTVDAFPDVAKADTGI